MKLLALFALISLPLAANSSLHELYTQARQFDPQFIQAQATWQIEQEKLPRARAKLLPNINAQANITKADTENSGGGSQFRSGGKTTTKGYNLTLVQSIYNHGAWSGYNAAKQQVNSAEANYKAAEQNLVIRLAEAYFNVLFAQDNLQFAHAEQTAIQQQQEDNQALFDVGMIAITDLHETQAAADLARASAIEAKNQLMSNQETLYSMIGSEVNINALNQPPKLQPPSPNTPEHWQESALANNVNVLAAQATLQARMDEVSAQRSAHYPNVELVAQHNQNDQSGGNFGNTESEDNRVILRLNVPIYSGGSVNAVVRSAAAQRDAAKRLLNWQKRQAQQEARQAFNNVTAAIARAEALSKAEKSSQTSLISVQDGYEAGTRTNTDVLTAKREVLRAKRNLSRAHYDYLLNMLKLKQSAGQLSVGDLKLIQ